MSAYRPPLTRSELCALIAYATSPPPAPLHPLDAAELLRPEPDVEHEATVDRILERVDPPLHLPPIQISKQGFNRLSYMFMPPSRVRRWYAWRSDFNQMERSKDVERTTPASWDHWGDAYVPDYWHGQWIPHPRGPHCGHFIRWRRIVAWPSTAGETPVTLDDLTAIVDDARARRLASFGLPPAQRRSWRDFLQPWAEERERTYESAHAAAASGAT